MTQPSRGTKERAASSAARINGAEQGHRQCGQVPGGAAPISNARVVQ